MAVLLSATWTVSPRRDRVGYRLNGQAMQVGFAPAFPEPIPVGAVQIGPEGLPVVAMRDAPTLGGYPVVGVLEPNDVGRLAQCRSGQKVAFVWAGRRP
jgi:allophanate hydrolase subunit 2